MFRSIPVFRGVPVFLGLVHATYLLEIFNEDVPVSAR